MSRMRSTPDARASSLSLCHFLCLCATWIRYTSASPQAASNNDAQGGQGGGGLALIPSMPQDTTFLSSTVAVSQSSAAVPPPFLIPSKPADNQPSPPPASPAIPSATQAPTLPLIPSFRPIPSAPIPSNALPITPTISYVVPGMTSTAEGLKPIPPANTQVGNPDGHHEITEPNFTATKPCNGCSPVVEMSASGWVDSPAEEQHGTTTAPIRATISAGASNILVSQAASDGKFVIDGTNIVTPGQTVTIDNTPLAVQTTNGRVEVIVGTEVVQLLSENSKSKQWQQTTRAPTPLPPVLTVGSDTIIANPQTQYVVGGQTLSPGGPAITVSGSTLSLAPSATAVVINGATSSLVPNFGYIYTTAAPVLTFKEQTYTVNRAGYITISPGTVLKPGGAPVTVDGTTLSLDSSGTAVVIQGSTSILQPVQTVVTLTRSVGLAGAGSGNARGGNSAAPTGKSQPPAKPVSGASIMSPGLAGSEECLGSLLVLAWWAVGMLAIRL